MKCIILKHYPTDEKVLINLDNVSHIDQDNDFDDVSFIRFGFETSLYVHHSLDEIIKMIGDKNE